jgi:hypothetical protein
MAAARAAKTAGKSKAAGGGVSFATTDEAAPKKMRARQATKFVRASTNDDGEERNIAAEIKAKQAQIDDAMDADEYVRAKQLKKEREALEIKAKQADIDKEKAGSEEKHVDFKVMDEDAVPAPTTQKRESQRKIRARKPTAFVKRTADDDEDGEEEEEADGGGGDLRDAMAAARAAKTAGKSKSAGGGVSFATTDEAATKFVRASTNDDGEERNIAAEIKAKQAQIDDAMDADDYVRAKQLKKEREALEIKAKQADIDKEEAGSEEKHVDFKVMDEEDSVPAPSKRESQRKIRARKHTAFVKHTGDDEENEDDADDDGLMDAMRNARNSPKSNSGGSSGGEAGGVRFVGDAGEESGISSKSKARIRSRAPTKFVKQEDEIGDAMQAARFVSSPTIAEEASGPNQHSKHVEFSAGGTLTPHEPAPKIRARQATKFVRRAAPDCDDEKDDDVEDADDDGLMDAMRNARGIASSDSSSSSSDDDRAKVKELYNKLDTDNSGALDRAELEMTLQDSTSALYGAMVAACMNPQKYVMQQLDTDSSGTVSFEEFCAVFDEAAENAE